MGFSQYSKRDRYKLRVIGKPQNESSKSFTLLDLNKYPRHSSATSATISRDFSHTPQVGLVLIIELETIRELKAGSRSLQRNGQMEKDRTEICLKYSIIFYIVKFYFLNVHLTHFE